MSKRKTLIELQSKPENKAVRRLFDKPKTVEYAPLGAQISDEKASEEKADEQAAAGDFVENVATNVARKSKAETIKNSARPDNESDDFSAMKSDRSAAREKTGSDAKIKNRQSENKPESISSSGEPPTNSERLRIFQTSTPVTRTVTKFQKAAIVVRGENGKQLVELLWRDQMNEKTRHIWDFLVRRFQDAAETSDIVEISLRKREILDQSGVKSDRTFINAIYTLEDMGLIEVKRLSGNKEGNIYLPTAEGREEMENYIRQNPSVE